MMMHLLNVHHMLLIYLLIVCILLQFEYLHATPPQQQKFQTDIPNGTITKNLSPFYPPQQSTAVLEKSSPTQKLFASAELAENFEKELFSLRDNELMVSVVQNLYDTIHSSSGMPTPSRNHTKILAKIAGNLTNKILNTIKVINETSNNITDSLHSSTCFVQHQSEKTENVYLESVVMPCSSNIFLCNNDEVNGNFSNNLCLAQNFSELLNKCGQSNEFYDRNFTINSRIVKNLAAITDTARLNELPNFRDVYFLAKDNGGDTGKCGSNLINQQYRYLLTSSIKSKNIVLLIDHGASEANEEYLTLAKSLALNIIQLLNKRDYLTLIGVSDKITTFNEYYQQQLLSQTPNSQQPNLTKTHSNHKTMEMPKPEVPVIHAANADTKSYFKKFLNTLNKTKELTNHALAFESAFGLIEEILNLDRFKRTSSQNVTPVLLLYVSRGLISEPTEVSNVLKIIASGQSRLIHPIVIDTCAIILDEKRVMYEKQFLLDIASQNYAKYNINVDITSSGHKNLALRQGSTRDRDSQPWHRKLSSYPSKGKMFTVNKQVASEMIAIATAIINNAWFSEASLLQGIQQNTPFYDFHTKDVILPFTQTCDAFGVFGINLYLNDIAEEIIYYSTQSSDDDDSYTFLLTSDGFTLWHPSYPRPQAMESNVSFLIDITYLENVSELVKSQWLHQETGNVTVTSKYSEEIKTYTWQHISKFLIVCIARILKPMNNHNDSLPLYYQLPQQFAIIFNDTLSAREKAVNNLRFHRLDIDIDNKTNSSTIKLCRYFNALSVQENLILFLSAGAFSSPFNYLRSMCVLSIQSQARTDDNGCVNRINTIMSYIKDPDNRLKNPGLQPRIREDVITAAYIMDLFKTQHEKAGNEMNKYIIRRFTATLSGALLLYPGCALPNDFDMSRRLWYQKVMDNPDKMVISEPYLDACGSGYVVTISHAIYQTNPSRYNGRNYNKQKPITAIVSIDVTRAFLYHLLLKSSEICENNEYIKCVLIESMGYIIVHPSILQPGVQNLNSGYERPITIAEHITHKESFIARDMLIHEGFVSKTLCKNQWTQKMLRFYKFNMSVTGILTNRLNGERSRYEAKVLSETNALLIVINVTEGAGGTAFCPCSRVDQVCLNCNRIELVNCECPCECPLTYGQIAMDEPMKCREHDCLKSVTLCPTPLEQTVPKKIDWPQELWSLNACLNYSCEIYTTQYDCLGVVGCEWCQMDVDGVSVLSSPFCTQQFACYDGVLGSMTPYGEGELLAINVDLDSLLPSAYAAIVPMIAAIIVLCLVIVYCYRQSLDPSSEQLYVDYLPNQNNFGLPISLLDYDSIMPHSNGLDKSDNSIILQSDASPYCVPAGHLRQPNGESDYGYSTMTPHEDSDHICFNLVEPLISSKRSISESLSTNADRLISPNTPSPVNYLHQHYHHHYHNHNQLRHPNSKKRDSYATPSDHCDNNGTTLLSSPHQIQAPVTVHKEMEAS